MRGSTPALLFLLGIVVLSALGRGEVSPAVLTRCEEIRDLSLKEAKGGRLVRVKGVVTLVPNPTVGGFTLDDGTGIWVARSQGKEAPGSPMRLQVGDLLEITGRSRAGHFFPSIEAESIRHLGHAPQPQAKRISPIDLRSGLLDSQRVSIGGVVQAAENVVRGGRNELRLSIWTRGGRFNFTLFDGPALAPEMLLDATIETTGVFLAYFNSRRQFVGVRVWSNHPDDLHIVTPAPKDPFTSPEVSLDQVLSLSSLEANARRRKASGTVTFFQPGRFLYIQEGIHALKIHTSHSEHLEQGARIEAAGFFQLTHQKAEMHEAVIRRLGGGPAPVPQEISRTEVLGREGRPRYTSARDYDDYLISLQGRLLNVDHRRGEPVRLHLECEEVLVPVELAEGIDPSPLEDLRPGSELRVAGICTLTYSEATPVLDWPRPIAMGLLLRSTGDVSVLRTAPWWTPGRLGIALGLLAAGLLIALAWIAWLRRAVAQRSAELAEAMRARRDAAVEFESTLRERNRLAADLHDTTEQSLTGLALQLEACEGLQAKAPERSQQHLSLARQLLDRSREDLRRSIWNLRSSPLDRGTLQEALRQIATDRSAGLPIRITVEARGRERPLPDFVAGNLLLLTQEGITNALKHATPSDISVTLVFAPSAVSLLIEDNGSGFDPATAAGHREGHFGLQGMRERMKRLGGTLSIESAPGRGTRITASLPGF